MKIMLIIGFVALLALIVGCSTSATGNAVVDGDYLLRACVVNFRTTESDIDFVIALILEIGRSLDEEMRPGYLAA